MNNPNVPEIPRAAAKAYDQAVPPFPFSDDRISDANAVTVASSSTTHLQLLHHFFSAEDRNLCLSWLEVSQYPIVGTGQKGTDFWMRVTKSFHQAQNSGAKGVFKSVRWGHPTQGQQILRRSRSGLFAILCIYTTIRILMLCYVGRGAE